MPGALQGLRIIEIAGIGPGPFACMMLADHGAEVIRIERPNHDPGTPRADPVTDVLNRSRRTLGIDIKSEAGAAIIRDLARTADGLVEGFRPGVMERLGLGPDVLRADNPRLVYGRITGWGQDGPYSQAPGHDINYIALAGALHAFGRAGGKPTPPLNTVADFGGGGMMLAFGMVSAMLHAQRTGEGQVVDCAMAEGASLLMALAWSFHEEGQWRDARGANILDTGAHFYETYETADGRFIALGAIEPQFYAALLRGLGLSDDPVFADPFEPARWHAAKHKLEQVFLTRSRDEWCVLLEPLGACFAPVLSLAEAPAHPHHKARGNFVEVAGRTQPAPAPRFSATPVVAPHLPDPIGDEDALFTEIGIDGRRLAELRARRVIG